MKAVVLNGPKQLDLAEVNDPEADGNNVIIRVTACGICGSDLHYWEMGVGMDGLPGLIMGHEFCGTVHDPGSRKDLQPGDRVTALPINPCMTCENCMNGRQNICLNGLARPNPGNNSPGAYAEYIAARPDMVRRLPDTISDREAALIEPASVALHAVMHADINIGESVLITGGGPIGLLCGVWARVNGAGRIILTEPDDYRIDFSKSFEVFDTVLDAAEGKVAKQIRRMTKGGVDAVIETSAADAGLQTAISSLKPRGRLVLAGISLQPQSVPTIAATMKELTIQASFAYTPAEFDMTMAYLSGRKINIGDMVTRDIELEAVPETFRQLTAGQLKEIKVMIHPI